MFILTKIADLVQIAPAQFEKHSKVAIENNINAKYSNRVLQKIGLCICMYDLLWASEGLIGHGTGLVNVNGNGVLLVIAQQALTDLHSRVPAHRIPAVQGRDFAGENQQRHPRRFEHRSMSLSRNVVNRETSDHNEQAWVWVVEEQRMYYDKNEMVRLQVIDEDWHDQIPESTSEEAVEKAKKISPYSIRGTMMKEGLGCCLWWE
ncbi:RNA polymerase III subunit Rpc25 [Seiridium cupressi]